MVPSRSWLNIVAAEIEMAPGFLAALDRQLRSHARSLTGVDLESGGYALLPPDDGFTVQPIQPNQEGGDLEFFWVQFPVAELSAGTQVDTVRLRRP